MKKLVMILMLVTAVSANAAITSVVGPNSTAGTAPAIIGAPADVLDNTVTNTGMQGFDEAQGVVTTVAHAIDGGGSIAAGTRVDSHMIFLNNNGEQRRITHFQVDWTFDGEILGVMSDRRGRREAASSFELGAPLTNYTVASSGDQAAPFGARGLEGNAEGLGRRDGYLILDPHTIRVDMVVTQPGDWMRVVTASPVPAPGALLLGSLGVGFAGWMRRRRSL